MKLIKKYLFIASIFTIFLLTPLSIQINNTKHNIQQNNIALQLNIVNAESFKADNLGLLDCGSYMDFNIACGLSNFLYSITVNVGNYLVGLSAIIMDYFLAYSLQSSSYNGSDFIKNGWEILRNITNIIFIFALLFVAFQMVLGSGKGNAKSSLMKIILVTLTINFSMFFSYAIIDISNIFAHVFYNKIDQANVEYETKINLSTGSGGSFEKKSVSLAIGNKINPQKLFSGGTRTAGQQALMAVMAGIINGSMIYVFLSVSFLFLGRTIGLWIAVVLAPLAFASLTIPKMTNIDYVGWQKWLPSLLKMSFMAPVFIFILYLAVQFMNIFTLGNNPSTLQNMLDIIVPMSMIIALLLLAKKIANKMSGDFAGVISSMVGKVVGGTLALGAMAVTGGVAGASALAGTASRGLGVAAKAGGKMFKSKGLTKFGEKAISKGKRMSSTKVMNVTKMPGFNKILPKELQKTSSFFSKNIAGKSSRSVERNVTLGAMKAKEKIQDVVSGKEFVESEHQFNTQKEKYKKEQEKRKKGAASWQEKMVDSKASDDIKSEYIDILKEKDAATGKSNKELIDGFKEIFSKGLTVNGTANNPEEVEYVQNGRKAKTKLVDASGNPVSRATHENTIIKMKEKDIKEKERNLNNYRATGNIAEIKKATKELNSAENELLEFKKQTITVSKEKAGKIEKNLQGQAREKVASKIETKDKSAANRIRSGKVKVDFDAVKEKTE